MSGHDRFSPDGGSAGFILGPAGQPLYFIGQIRSVIGSCTLTRQDSAPQQIEPGTPICQGDIIETAAGGKVGILFIDGTAFNLSDNARAVVKEFDRTDSSPSAKLDVSRGTFAFIAGEMAKFGSLIVETPFGSIRGRTQAGGIGMLSLASLFFTALEQAQAGTPDLAYLDDGVINFKDSQEFKDAKFGVIELTVHATPLTPEHTLFIDDPSQTIVLRRVGSSISESYVSNSITQMLQYQSDQQDALHTFSLGQGPTVTGPGGSGTAPPSGPPVFFIPINFTPPPDHDPPPPPPGGGAPGSTGTGTIFVPPPPPPPPPPGETISPTIGTDEGLTASITSGGLTKDNTLTVSGTVTATNLSSVSVHVLLDGSTDLGAATIDSAGNWSLTTNPLSDGPHTFTAVASDGASPPVSAGPVSATIDTVPPSVTIATDDNLLKLGDVAHLTFTLSEDSTNFAANDIAVTGGTLSNFAGSGHTYTADFTPTPGTITNATVDVAGAKFTDAAGNDNTPATQLTMAVNTAPTVAVADGTPNPTTEGTDATITFTVSLTDTADHDVTVAYHLVNGTAVAGSDFADAGSGTVTIAAGQTSANITVNVINDNVVESPEAFSVKLDAATYDQGGANQTALSVTDTTGAGNITDNDTSSITLTGPATVAEGATTGAYAVNLSGGIGLGAGQSVTFTLDSASGTATEGSDFAALLQAGLSGASGIALSGITTDADGTIHVTATNNTGADLASGATLVTFTIATTQDSVVEATENFSVTLGSATANVTNATVTTAITDNDTATWSLTGSASVTEGNAANYTVHLAGTLGTGVTATINLAIADISTTSADYASFAAAVTAAIGSRTDLAFNSGTGTLTFTGTGSAMSDLVISLGTVNDSALEDNEQFKVSLTTPGSGTGSSIALDPTHASVTTTIIDNDPKAGTAITLDVNEAALSTGSNPSLTTETDNTPSLSFTASGFNLTSFAFSTDLSGLQNDLNSDGTQDIFWVRDSGTQISGYLDAAHTVLADRLTLSAPASIAADTSGSVTVTETLSAAVKNPSGGGAQVNSLGHVDVVATDTNSDTANGTVNLNVQDDTPHADLVSTSITPTDSKTNLTLILDLSGSMDDPSGLTGLSRLDVAKAAINELLEQYDNRGSVMVQLVTFSDSANSHGSVWLSVDAAKAVLASLTAGGGTNYEAAISTAISAFGEAGKLTGPGTQNVSYFMSDGVPTAGEGINSTDQANWETFLTSNHVISYAIGIGNGVTTNALNPIAFDPAPGTQQADTPMVVTDLNQLADTLVFSIPPVSGAFVTGVNGATQGSFGADGGHIQSITVDGVTYTFDPSANTVTNTSATATYDQASHTLTVDTDTSKVGGEFAIVLTTGAFTFQPTAGFTSESIGYTLVDNDGDTASNTLTFTASGPVDHPPVVRDDHVITNISGSGAAINIPSSALLFNDTDADGNAITVTATSGATSGSASPASGNPIATVTFTDDNSNGGSFVYTGSTASPAASDTGVVTVDRSQTGTTLNGTGLGEILIGRDGSNNTINAFEGNDVLIGGTGNDTLVGGAGSDSINGGTGNDVVVENAVAGTSSDSARVIVAGNGNDAGQDTVVNFDVATDTLRVVASGVSNFVHGTDTAVGTAGGTDNGTASSFLTNVGLVDLNHNGNFGDAGDIAVTFTSPIGTFNEANFEARLQYVLTGTSGADTITTGAGDDTITGGAGADTMTGGGGADTFVIATGDSKAVIGGSGNAGTIAGYDVITDFVTSTDILNLQGSPHSPGNTNGTNGTDSTLTINGQTIKSHAITNGIITFDDANSFSAALSLTSMANVAAVVDYLQHNDLGNGGTTVAFTATIGLVNHTFVYEQVGTSPNSANDILVDLSGTTVSDLSALISSGHVDPVVLDLGAPGISFSSLANGVTFDINGDGAPDQVAWTASNDGILAYNTGSGTITNGTQLFTPNFAGGSFDSGLAALASLDSNNDGVINSADSAFNNLIVWQDNNHDGIADLGEVSSLSDHGIVAIDLDATPTAATIDGQQLQAQGSFVYADGTTGSFVEVNLDSSLGTAPTPPTATSNITGTADGDTLIAAPGSTLTGAGGNDTFVFKAVTDSQPGAGHYDTIADFIPNTDHIDLSAIAGATTVQGQVAEANTVAANSISWFADAAHNETIVYVNTTATANHVDMEIHLTGSNISLQGSDILHHS